MGEYDGNGIYQLDGGNYDGGNGSGSGNGSGDGGGDNGIGRLCLELLTV